MGRAPGRSAPGESAEDLVTEEQHGSLPELMARALGVATMRVIETGGDSFEAEREQWDDGNNVVALEPGVVIGYERNTGTNTALRKPASRRSRSRDSSWVRAAAAAIA